MMRLVLLTLTLVWCAGAPKLEHYEPPAAPTPFCVDALAFDKEGNLHTVRVCTDSETFCVNSRKRAVSFLESPFGALAKVGVVGECHDTSTTTSSH